MGAPSKLLSLAVNWLRLLVFFGIVSIVLLVDSSLIVCDFAYIDIDIDSYIIVLAVFLVG